jgi:hypothetical protein
MDKLLEKSGCSSRMLVTGDARALLGGTLDVVGEPATPPGTASTARLVRASPPGAHLAFADTPVVAPAVWQPLQNQRVRYFRRPSKKTVPDAGAPPPAPTDTGTPAGGGNPPDPTGATASGDSRGTPGAGTPSAGTTAPVDTAKP